MDVFNLPLGMSDMWLLLITFEIGRLRFNGTDTDVLLLRPSAFSVKQFEIVLTNIRVLDTIKTSIQAAGALGFAVSAGWQLGLPKSRSGCSNFVHVAMRLIKNTSDYSQDPSAYLSKAPLAIPSWVSQADQWYIKLLVITIKQVKAFLHTLSNSLGLNHSGYLWGIVQQGQRRRGPCKENGSGHASSKEQAELVGNFLGPDPSPRCVLGVCGCA